MVKKKISDPFLNLESKNLIDWAGTKNLSLGRQYQTEGRVHELARSKNGAIVAFVNGTEQYTTVVYFEKGMKSICTCPVGSCCKHAVAVILEYLARVDDNRPIPDLAANDSRVSLIPDGAKGIPESSQSGTGPYHLQNLRSLAKEKTTEKSQITVRDYLSGLTREDLISLIEYLMSEYPQSSHELTDIKSITESGIGPELLALLSDIYQISSEVAYGSLYDDDSHIPDYYPVVERMTLLLERGYPDAVIDAGGILIKRCTVQLEQSDDMDGLTADEIEPCMDLVFQALECSSRPDHERMVFVIQVKLDDEYGICDHKSLDFLKKDYPASEWGLVADRLLQQLGEVKIKTESEEFYSAFHRDHLVGWIVTALDHAGREKEADELCVTEVERTENYERLIRRLIQNGKREEAGTWILRGITATIKSLPGIAVQLRTLQREIWENEGDHFHVAGVRAEEFLCNPSCQAYCDLKLSSEKIGVWDTVRVPVMQYLKDGTFPIQVLDDKTKSPLIFGALPRVGLTDMKSFKIPTGPFLKILIDIAIEEQQPDEVILWYDRILKLPGGSGMNYHSEDKFADVVAEKYPDRALIIWKEKVEKFMDVENSKFYEFSIIYINKIRSLMKSHGMNAAWGKYLAKIQKEHAGKKRFIKLLMDIEGKKIKKS
ncbi:MAG: SWIM zinc finger family protein [Methanoregula sp.]|nr:SWIM zinc finger family protein [Methanoregula sp.]